MPRRVLVVAIASMQMACAIRGAKEYLAIEPEFAAYEKLTFPKEDSQLKAALEAKQKALREVELRYRDVVNVGAAEPAICSLYKIGLLYRNFAETLTNAPIPEAPFPEERLQEAGGGPFVPYWNVPWAQWPRDLRDALPEETFAALKQRFAAAAEDFKQAYRSQLEKWALPLQRKAADSFALAVEKSRKLGTSNDCSERARALLGQKGGDGDVGGAKAPASSP